MPSMWFIVPAHGRHQLARICLRQLRHTCDQLSAEGVDASAVVVACDENLDAARELGFATVRRDNRFLSRRYNDGIQLALDPELNPRPADYVVPCGSDDWVDHRIFLDLPRFDTIVGFQRMSFVHPDGKQIGAVHLRSLGGCGIRIYPRETLAPLGYRPADEDRRRGCDTSILTNVQQCHNALVEHRHLHDRQIVDWKSPTEQVTPWDAIQRRHGMRIDADPFEQLAGVYPADLLAEMRAVYEAREQVAA